MVALAGILALQGGFEAHEQMLARLGARTRQVRLAADFEGLDGLIIPGGESTTMWKLLHDEALVEPLRAFVAAKPVLGTCAGAILLARKVTHPAQEALGAMDYTAVRNAYGRQIDSRVTTLTPEPEFEDRTEPGDLEAVFIRAPILRDPGEEVTVLVRYQDDPVLVEQGQYLAATFHPELTDDPRVHSLFLGKLGHARG